MSRWTHLKIIAVVLASAASHAHAGGDGAFIKVDRAYYCAASDGQSVARYLSPDGTFIEQWKEPNAKEAWAIFIGQYSLRQSANGDVLTRVGERRYSMRSDKWAWPDKDKADEIITAGSREERSIFQTRFVDGKSWYMKCERSEELDEKIRALTKKMQPLAIAADEKKAIREDSEKRQQQKVTAQSANLRKDVEQALNQLVTKIKVAEKGNASPNCRNFLSVIDERLRDGFKYYNQGVESEKQATYATSSYYSSALKSLQIGLGYVQQYCQ